MRLCLAILLVTAFCGEAAAQQQAPDPAFLQRAIAVLQDQRTKAQDNAVYWQATYEGIAAELAKANARIAELEKAVPKPAPEPQP